MPFTCSAEERQKDAREDAKCFFLPRRRADGASLGCTTNFALDGYFAPDTTAGGGQSQPLFATFLALRTVSASNAQ